MTWFWRTAREIPPIPGNPGHELLVHVGRGQRILIQEPRFARKLEPIRRVEIPAEISDRGEAPR